MAATIVVKRITANPVKVQFSFNGADFEQEWPSRAAALNELQQTIQPDANITLALALVLRQWQQSDPTLTNLSGLVGHTCTINNPVVTIV